MKDKIHLSNYALALDTLLVLNYLAYMNNTMNFLRELK